MFARIKIFLPLLLVFVTPEAFSQNRIVLKDRVIEHAKLHEIKGTAVVYEQNGSLHDVPKDQVLWIEGENDLKISFDDQGNPVYGNLKQTNPLAESLKENDFSNKSPEEMFRMGQEDARLYYHAPLATVAGVLYTWYLIPPAVALLAPVNVEKNIQPESLRSNKNYVDGYVMEAKKKKLGNVLKGAGVTTAVALVVVGFIVIAFSH